MPPPTRSVHTRADIKRAQLSRRTHSPWGENGGGEEEEGSGRDRGKLSERWREAANEVSPEKEAARGGAPRRNGL